MSKPRTTEKDTVFFTVMPGPATANRIQRFAMGQRSALGLSGKPQQPRVLHVSLQALGYYDRLSPDEIERAKRAADNVRRPRFEVGFDRLLSFKRRNHLTHPLVLCGGDGIVGLELLLGAIRASLGLPEAAAFTPHMTLLYDEQMVEEILLEEPLKWFAEEFVLVRSLVGLARYEILGRWPLMSRAQYLGRPEAPPDRPQRGDKGFLPHG